MGGRAAAFGRSPSPHLADMGRALLPAGAVPALLVMLLLLAALAALAGLILWHRRRARGKDVSPSADTTADAPADAPAVGAQEAIAAEGDLPAPPPQPRLARVTTLDEALQSLAHTMPPPRARRQRVACDQLKDFLRNDPRALDWPAARDTVLRDDRRDVAAAGQALLYI